MFRGFLIGAIIGSLVMIFLISFPLCWPYYLILGISSLIYYNLKEKK
jgi:uncharacterized membrane protein YoaK (UPF0700 family)